jgi:hypothetical protein
MLKNLLNLSALANILPYYGKYGKKHKKFCLEILYMKWILLDINLNLPYISGVRVKNKCGLGIIDNILMLHIFMSYVCEWTIGENVLMYYEKLWIKKIIQLCIKNTLIMILIYT